MTGGRLGEHVDLDGIADRSEAVDKSGPRVHQAWLVFVETLVPSPNSASYAALSIPESTTVRADAALAALTRVNCCTESKYHP